MDELKPCPFCGGTRVDEIQDDPWIRIECLNCGASAPNAYDEKSAVTAWNTRASDSQAERIKFLEHQVKMLITKPGKITREDLEWAYESMRQDLDKWEEVNEVLLWVAASITGRAWVSNEPFTRGESTWLTNGNREIWPEWLLGPTPNIKWPEPPRRIRVRVTEAEDE